MNISDNISANFASRALCSGRIPARDVMNEYVVFLKAEPVEGGKV